MQLSPLPFEKIGKHDSRVQPPVPHSDSGWIRTELVSLHHAKDHLVVAVRFYPSREDHDSIKRGVENVAIGSAVLHVLARKGHWFGATLEAVGFRLQRTSRDSEYIELECRGAEMSGHRGRNCVHLFLARPTAEWPTNETSISIYFKTGFFGGWKEVIIDENYGAFCVASSL